jgi:uncharacterized protein related to proFAR isomerase
MNESAYSTLLKHVENTEYTENLTENEKRKLRKQAKHYVSKDNLYTTLVQREKLDEWLEKQKSIGSFVLAIPIVPLVNISSMPYLESEQ